MKLGTIGGQGRSSSDIEDAAWGCLVLAGLAVVFGIVVLIQWLF